MSEKNKKYSDIFSFTTTITLVAMKYGCPSFLMNYQSIFDVVHTTSCFDKTLLRELTWQADIIDYP